MPEEIPKSTGEQDLDKLPESFLIEYMNSRGIEIGNAMLSMGFRLMETKHEGDDTAVFVGEKAVHPLDGTKIEMRIKKGSNYKSPQQVAREEIEAKEKTN